MKLTTSFMLAAVFAGSLSFVSDTAFFGDVMTQSLGLVGKIVRVDCGSAR